MDLRGASLGVPASSGAGAAQATRRIQRELKEISESPSRYWTAGPVGDDLFEWQFVMRGPPGTDYEGGIYVGRIILPVNYPLAPPSITLLTPNGRWEVGKKICLSNTNYHPDLWQPAWGIRTMMEALRSHFPMPGDGAIGALDWPSELRRKLAVESLDWRTQPGARPNRELLPELTPEELREEMPEPAPSVPPQESQEELSAAPRPPSSADGAGPESSVFASPAASPAPAASPVATPMDTGREEPSSSPSPEGLRCRRGAPSEAPGDSGAGALGSQDAASASSAGGSAAPRRRRQPARQQRRPQPLLVQILKPPRSGREWVLLLMDLLIALLTISFFLGLTDLIRTPPKLLDPLPDARSSTE